MLVERMIRAARLDVNLYEEVEADESLTTEAAIVVVLASVAAGISGLIRAIFGAPTVGSALRGLIGGTIGLLIGWLIISFLCYFIGTSLFKGQATYGELLRTLGYAQAPALLRIFTFIPFIGRPLGVVILIWTLITTVIGARQALDLDTGQTIIVCVIAFVADVLLLWIVGLIFGVGWSFVV